MQESVSAVIDSTSGSFSLSLGKDNDWLLVLINSAATGTGRYVGSVALNTASADSLLNLPATSASISSFVLGTVSRPEPLSGDAVSAATVTATSFNMTAEQLALVAKNDDLFRNAMNIVNNYGTLAGAVGGVDVYYYMRPDFSWTGDYSTLTSTYSSPSMTFKGMSFQLDTNSTSITMDMLCSAGTTTLKLIPPAAISDGAGHAYDPTTPITNADATCTGITGGQQAGGTNFFATNVFGGTMSYSVQADFQTVPSGEWIWQEDDVTRAAFDIKTVNPPLTPADGPSGFVPSFKINVDPADQRITSVDIKWFYYDAVHDVYVEVAPADLKIVKHFVEQAEVAFDRTYLGIRYYENIYFDPSVTSRVYPAQTWYYGVNADHTKETGLMGFYESGGFGYFYHFFNPDITS
jgi:hypothetical protein